MSRHRRFATTTNRIVSTSVVAVVTAILVAGCGASNGKGGKTPTPAPTVPATSGATAASPAGAAPLPIASPGATPRPAALTATNAHQISDGTCQALIPDDWADGGTGRGTTVGGNTYVLFGGRVRSDGDWRQAVALVTNQTAARPGAQVVTGTDFVRVIFPNDHGFAYRGRFGDRYCDFSVTSLGKPIPPTERAAWDAIVASLGPATRTTPASGP